MNALSTTADARSVRSSREMSGLGADSLLGSTVLEWTSAAARVDGDPARSFEDRAAQAVNAPRVWVLASPRAGEQTQLLALAKALGQPYTLKQVVYRPLGVVPGSVGHEGLVGVDRERSDALTGPWPDLVLLAHHSNEGVARWIRRQSGGRTRIVLLGRPWSSVKSFDLVITTPQYNLPEAQNVLLNPLPLHQVSAERLAAAAAEWGPRLAHLPRPFVTVLVGGSSGPYILDAAAAARLGREASGLARELGGSVLVTTSARTPAEVADALFAAIDAPAYLHRWSRGSQDNPYFGFIGLADRIVVTADSISMIAEACASGRPVQLFDFGGGPLAMREGSTGAPGTLAHRLLARFYALCMRLPKGRFNRTRDLRIVHRALLAAGRVSWLGEPLPQNSLRLAGNELTRTVNRLRDLLRDQAAPVRLPRPLEHGPSATMPVGDLAAAAF